MKEWGTLPLREDDGRKGFGSMWFANLLHPVREGGIIILPLLLLGVLLVFLFAERAFYFHRNHVRAKDFVRGILNLVEKRRLAEALTLCNQTPGSTSDVVRAALLQHEGSEDDMRRAVQAAALIHIPGLERRINVINALAFVAPILGLLGALVGMHETIANLLGQGAGADLAQMTTGFSKALICSIYGVGLSAIAHIGHFYLMDRVRALVEDMEWAAHKVMVALLSKSQAVSDSQASPGVSP